MTQLPTIGLCQWFHYEDAETVERTVELLHELGVQHLRTGISWADYHRPGGKSWYDWQMRQLADFDVLLSVWHTPPSLAEDRCCNGPPRRLEAYAEFLWQVNDEYGEYYDHVELWNEPNNFRKWDFRRFDPQWAKFAAMIRPAAAQVRRDGKQSVLGGMIPVDRTWLDLLDGYGALDEIEVVAIHGFPEMWWPDHPNWEWYEHWKGWKDKVDLLAPACGDRPIWITETGLATWDLDGQQEAWFERQVRMLDQASRAPVERVYWYSLIDLDPAREAIEGFHVDENEYHMGLVTWNGAKKDAFDRLQDLLSARTNASTSSVDALRRG